MICRVTLQDRSRQCDVERRLWARYEGTDDIYHTELLSTGLASAAIVGFGNDFHAGDKNCRLCPQQSVYSLEPACGLHKSDIQE